MKIAQVTEFFAPWLGGISEHVSSLTRELRRLGHDVHIVTGGNGKNTQDTNDPVLEHRTWRLGHAVHVPYNGGISRVTYGLGVARQLDALFARESFDIVHVHNPMMPVLPLLALDRSPALTAGTFHSYHERDRMVEWWRWALRGPIGRLGLSIAVSPAAREAVHRYFELPFEIVPNGVDVAAFAPNGHPKTPATHDLLFVGMLVPRKGLTTLLDAVPLLLDEFPNLRLRVVGHGPMRRRSERRLGALGRRHVEFLGPQTRSRLIELYRTCDVYCAPSLGHESFGITLLEAMAAGKPIVASRIPGFSDVVQHEREALLHRKGDVRDLRDALRRVLTDAPLRHRLGAQARITVERYGWPRVAQQVDALYERLLASA